jgi:hypothetical protein
MFTLPGVCIQEPIEVDGLAFVSSHDARIIDLAEKHRRFRMYLKRFTTEFGDPITPSFILCRNDRYEKYRSAEVLAAFRDSIAISCISRGWALALKYGNNHNVRYSNCFSFYPWLVDNNYKDLVMQSMAQIGAHEVKRLKGQTVPGISYVHLTRGMIDTALLDALLKRLPKRFSPEHDRSDVALFRSLNMGLSASALPGNVEATIFDIGRSVALWVSAFEILSKDGTCESVLKLLKAVKWNLSACSDAIYEPRNYKPGQPKISLPIWLYRAMNKARNDFIHGNEINEKTLIVAPGKQPMHLYTAPLFRMALTSVLGLTREPPSATKDKTAYDAYWQYSREFAHYQSDVEVALSTIIYTPKEYRELKQSRVESARSRSRALQEQMAKYCPPSEKP